MSAIANLVAFDGASTPVSHTFIPVEITRDGNTVTASYVEGSQPSVPTYALTRVFVKRAKLGSGVVKTTVRVEVPVMEAILNQNAAGYTAAPKVAYVDTVEMTGYFHERSVANGRRLARQLLVNIMGNVVTSVAASTGGPAAELVDQLIMPT